MDVKRDCQQVRRRLSALLEGELPPKQAAELRGHIDACQNCQLLVDTLEMTLKLYQQLPQPELPAGAAERLWSRLQASGCVKSIK